MSLSETASAATDAEESVVELRVEEEIVVEIESKGEDESVEEASIPQS